MDKKYQIFISYRRDGGEFTAKMLYDKLCSLGYQAFFDVESLRSCMFNEKLYSVIDECTDVLVILSPGALDRCENKDDWVRLEIEHALQKGKNVIPIMLRGFEFPEKLPESIEKLQYMQGLKANLEYFDAFINKLQKFFVAEPTTTTRKKIMVGCASLLAVIALIVALIHFLSPNPPDPGPDIDNNDTDNNNGTDEDDNWQNNILMTDATQTLNEDSGVLGSDIARRKILSITFLDSLDGMPDNAWDASAEKNQKVMAWTIAGDGGYDLYIGGKGGVAANEDSSYLFYAYTNVEKISINGNLHTENATNMKSMFDKCSNLRDLDVDKFDTSNVTDMSWMFNKCINLTSLNISNFDTSSVTTMYAMFKGCSNLKDLIIDVDKFDTSSVTEAANMFLGCESLNLKKSDVSYFSPELVETMGITW